MSYKYLPYWKFSFGAFCLLIGGIMLGYNISLWNIFGIFSAIFLTIIGFVILNYTTKNNFHNIDLILKAIRNNDYTLKFSRKDSGIVAQTLNEITNILADQKKKYVQQEKYYEHIINNLSIGIIVANDNGNILKHNIEILKLFDIAILTHLSQLKRFDNIYDVLINMQLNDKKHISLHFCDKVLDISIRVSQLEIKGQNLRIFTLNDIHTEIDRKEFDSWIKLTRILTHEIMNGIAPINSLSENLIKTEQTPPRIKDALKAINSTSISLLNFVESYHKYSSIPTPVPNLVYINDLIEQAQKIGLQYNSDVSFETSIIPTDLIVYADEYLISQVLTNIIKNAIEALKNTSNKKIRFRAYCDKNDVIKIEIANNGPTISNEEISQIFVPFFTTKESGSGIGLSISRQIMTLSNGNIQITTNNNDEFKTSFILSFD